MDVWRLGSFAAREFKRKMHPCLAEWEELTNPNVIIPSASRIKGVDFGF